MVAVLSEQQVLQRTWNGQGSKVCATLLAAVPASPCVVQLGARCCSDCIAAHLTGSVTCCIEGMYRHAVTSDGWALSPGDDLVCIRADC
jgi:hypothetical protein